MHLNTKNHSTKKSYQYSGISASFGLILIFFFIFLISVSPRPARSSKDVYLPLEKIPDMPENRWLRTMLKNPNVLRVGIQQDYQPFHIKESIRREGYPGLDVEMAELLQEAIGVERLEFHYGGVKELLQMVATDQVDVALGGLSSNIARGRYVSFTNPYIIDTSAALVSRKVLPAVSESVDFPRVRFESLSDLIKLGRITIGVQSETTHEWMLRNHPDFEMFRRTLQIRSSKSDLEKDLIAGKLDGIVADGLYVRALLLRRPDLKNRFIPLLKKYHEEHISMLVTPGKLNWLNYLNFFIKELRRTGVMEMLSDRYFESGDWLPDPDATETQNEGVER